MDATNKPCKHQFRRIISGPMLVIDWCRLCRMELVDIIDRGPNRLEAAENGELIMKGHKNDQI